jgi:hypothetical protein
VKNCLGRLLVSPGEDLKGVFAVPRICEFINAETLVYRNLKAITDRARPHTSNVYPSVITADTLQESCKGDWIER